MEESIERIEEYIGILSTKTYSEDLLEFAIGEVIDRVQLYLNSDSLPEICERIVAKIVLNNLNEITKNIEAESSNEDAEQVISSISDNGQSITFSNEVKKYYVNATDDDVLRGFTALLNRYRRIKVVYPKKNED
jgi:hypothetical protein